MSHIHGFHIRPAQLPDAPAVAEVHVATWRTAYAGIIPAAYLDQLDVNERAMMWHRALSDLQSPRITFVAEDAQRQIAGFAVGAPNREAHPVYTGELMAIYVLAAHQGKGLGKRLFQSLAVWLHEQGHHHVLLWVLADNRSGIAFYEALGGRRVGQKYMTIGGADLLEYAYGWDDLTPFLG